MQMNMGTQDRTSPVLKYMHDMLDTDRLSCKSNTRIHIILLINCEHILYSSSIFPVMYS